MNPKTRNILAAGVVAAVATLIIRVTVFTDDCNLLVVSFTFLATFAVASAIIWIFRFLNPRT